MRFNFYAYERPSMHFLCSICERKFYARKNYATLEINPYPSTFVLQRSDKKNMESDAPIALYYERLASVQSRGCQVTHQVLKDILREVQLTLVPEILLKEWAQYTYQDPSDYWTFRKQVL